MKNIVVAGVTGDKLSPDITNIIEQAGMLVCSEYIFSLLTQQGYSPEHLRWVPVTPLKESLNQIENCPNDTQIAILTSGDPLFFGIGKLLIKTFPDSTINFIPAISTMQMCFNRFGIPWDDAEHASLHGRPLDTLQSHSNFHKLFLFTDPKNSPRVIADYLIEKRGPEGCEGITVHVGEQLETEEELLYTGTLEEVTRVDFAEPNCMILVDNNSVRCGPVNHSRLGLKEEKIFHSRGLITKNEVRAAVLHALELPEKGVLWDIGSGSGSISIESSRLCPSLRVYSVERNSAELDNINRNRARFKSYNVEIVAGEAPGSLHSLPSPDRVFIGGSGGKLEDIIRYTHARLSTSGHFVMTAVTENSYTTGPRILYELGYSVTISVINTRRYTYPAGKELKLNPIHLIVAKKYD